MPFEEMPAQKAIAIRQQVRSPFPLDLIVRTSEQVQQRLEMGDFFIRDIMEKGHILYEGNNKRLG
jgi:uncharacterized protein